MGFGAHGSFDGFFSRIERFGGSGASAMVFSFSHGFRFRMGALNMGGLVQEFHSGTSLRAGV